MIIGPSWKHFTTIFLIMMQASMCILYTYLLGHFLNQFFCYRQFTDICGNRFATYLILLILLLPLTKQLSLKKSFKIILLADIFLITVLLVVSSYCIELVLNEGFQKYNDDFDFSFSRVCLHIGMQFYANDCTGRLFEIRHKMVDSSKFIFLLKRQYIISTFMQLVFPILFLFTFGNKLQEFALFNVPISRFLFKIMYIMYSFVLCISFQFQIQPVQQICREIVYGDTQDSNDNVRLDEVDQSFVLSNFFKTSMVNVLFLLILLVIFMMAYIIKYQGQLVSFVGSIASTYMVFIMPYLLYSKRYPQDPKLQLKKILMMIGVCLGILGAVFSLNQMIHIHFHQL